MLQQITNWFSSHNSIGWGILLCLTFLAVVVTVGCIGHIIRNREYYLIVEKLDSCFYSTDCLNLLSLVRRSKGNLRKIITTIFFAAFAKAKCLTDWLFIYSKLMEFVNGIQMFTLVSSKPFRLLNVINDIIIEAVKLCIAEETRFNKVIALFEECKKYSYFRDREYYKGALEKKAFSLIEKYDELLVCLNLGRFAYDSKDSGKFFSYVTNKAQFDDVVNKLWENYLEFKCGKMPAVFYEAYDECVKRIGTNIPDLYERIRFFQELNAPFSNEQLLSTLELLHSYPKSKDITDENTPRQLIKLGSCLAKRRLKTGEKEVWTLEKHIVRKLCALKISGLKSAEEFLARQDIQETHAKTIAKYFGEKKHLRKIECTSTTA